MEAAVQLRERLLDTAQAVTREHPDHPAGSVLRCYARAVRLVRLTGCPQNDLPEAARRATSELLRYRAVAARR